MLFHNDFMSIFCKHTISMALSLYFLLSTSIVTIQCAPKLGHVLFDPLSYEAKLAKSSKELPEDWLKVNLRMPTKIVERTKKPCSGYDYNETLCKTIEDRVICGYNKNIGKISKKIVHLGNGCRIRGDRLECGYSEGPFNVPRRPPASDEGVDNNIKILNLRWGPTRTSNILPQFNVTGKQSNYNVNVTTPKPTRNIKLVSRGTTKRNVLIIKTLPTISSILNTSLINNLSLLTAPTTNLTSISRRQSNVTMSKRYCVDKSDRIFCYSIQQ